MDGALAEGDWRRAAQLLAGPPNRANAEWERLVDGFVERMLDRIEGQAKKLASDQRFDDALEALKKRVDSAKALEGALQKEFPGVAKRVLNAQQALNDLDARLKKYWDDVLYHRVT